VQMGFSKGFISNESSLQEQMGKCSWDSAEGHWGETRIPATVKALSGTQVAVVGRTS
jgi:hypothetical protein